MKAAMLKAGTLFALGAVLAWITGLEAGYILGVVVSFVTGGVILPDVLPDDFD